MNKHRTVVFASIVGGALLCSSASWADEQSPSGTTSTTSGTSTAGETTTTGATYEGAPVGAEAEERKPPPNRPMLITGGVLFAGAYIPSAFVAAYSSNSDDKALWAPVVGPWIDLATRDCSGSCTAPDTWNAIGLIASGVAQAGGLAVGVASFFVPEKEGDRLLGSAASKQAVTKPKVQVTPLSFRAGAGIGAVGTF
jgi:hypothetical protein